MNDYTTFDKDFGRKAADFRKNTLGYTQQQLGDIIGVTRVSIARFEAGKMHSPLIASSLFDMGMRYFEEEPNA